MNDLLILLDVDGTIADRDSVEIYPKMRRFIEALGPEVEVALVTNQGGPACHDAGWDFSSNFPSLSEVNNRLGHIVKQILDMRPCEPALYVAWAYEIKNGTVIVPGGKVINGEEKERQLHWRKPGPGMIFQAINDYGVQIDQVVMIGDRPEDRQAAEAAGVAFRHADDI